MRFIVAFTLLMILGACSSSTRTVNGNENYEPCVSDVCGTEPSYCSSPTITDPVTISGDAYYVKRLPNGTGLGGPSGNLPIRFAEVAIVNGSGSVLGCGATDANGAFAINIQRVSASVYAQVRSRANTTGKLVASVLDSPLKFNYYKVTTDTPVTGNANRTLADTIAPHDGDIEGGAFNILDRLYEANEFLRTETAGCNTVDASCTPITNTPKVTAFWKPGFNPGTYLGNSASDTVSFYLSGTSRLYIVGGVSGNVNSADTDHFDDAVIVHEFGHFLEDIYAGSDSPGGSHNANSVIDPRLAWSEGWATYFSMSSRASPMYIDTYGNTDGTTGKYFYHNLDTNSPKRDPSSAGYTVPAGQGIFREFGISRSLLDMTDADAASPYDSDGTEIPFNEFWAIFAGSTKFPASSTKFRNAGLFFKQHDALAANTDITTSTANADLQDEFMYDPAAADYLAHYATPVASGACTDTASIKPANNNDKNEDGSFENSNQFSSNDFYHLTHAGGSLNLSLVTKSGTLDLDLYLYKEDYTYGEGSSILASSTNNGTASESISFSSLPAGSYMINVMVYTAGLAGTSEATWPTNVYDLFVNSSRVCP
ncbi:MAG: hypothetical protein KDD37_08400 [Bdellovibrionales bacterium]|nr:hypothetical protein [Bdellovibrionales bacterium]